VAPFLSSAQGHPSAHNAAELWALRGQLRALADPHGPEAHVEDEPFGLDARVAEERARVELQVRGRDLRHDLRALPWRALRTFCFFPFSFLFLVGGGAPGALRAACKATGLPLRALRTQTI